MKNISELLSIFEQNLSQIKDCFKSNINDYFFTEKELHSYFYHLCILNDSFTHHGYSLIHTEYPSPFKCSYVDNEPYIIQEPINAKKQRSHIDCVLLNPTFIDWILRKELSTKAISGIGNKRFDLYINSFYQIYLNFYQETKEPILLYALEFKYLRHSYSGTKYPIKEIMKDIGKLRLVSKYETNTGLFFKYVERTKLIIFIGERASQVQKELLTNLEKCVPREYDLITRTP